MKIFPIAAIAAILAVTVTAVPMEKRATCKTDDDCPGVTCCNLSTNKCVNDPNDTICGIPPTKTTTTKTKTTKTTSGTGKPTTKPQCKTDDDCPGVTCCNLNTNQCVNDPNDTICGIPPTKTTTIGTKTTTTGTGKPTATPQCKTDDDCPGVTCCNLSNNQCVNDPHDTICGIPPTKTTLTKTKTTGTGKPTSTPQCKTNDDCPGVTCCNLSTNKCVKDPNGTICDIPPK
ncbi:hypothetical protein VKS41_007619 [Umbelopsis sp. WA50703]